MAGHLGLVGSAIVRNLYARGFKNIITRSHKQLDLTNQNLVERFFSQESIDYVILAAAKVGGIYANNNYPAEFIYQNIMIEANVIHASYLNNVKKLLFLGSTCIYPKEVKDGNLNEFCEITYIRNTYYNLLFFYPEVRDHIIFHYPTFYRGRDYTLPQMLKKLKEMQLYSY